MKNNNLVWLCLVICTVNAWATVIDFEEPLPENLSPMKTFISGNSVPTNSIIGDTYSDLGIVFENAVLVELGDGQAPSGINGLGSVDDNGKLDYGTTIIAQFISLIDGEQGETDYFSVTTDLLGGSGNTLTLTAYNIDGDYMGSSSYTEGIGGVVVELYDVGFFHTVVIDETYEISGGIALDLIEYGDIIPEPCSLTSMCLGGILLKRGKRM